MRRSLISVALAGSLYFCCRGAAADESLPAPPIMPRAEMTAPPAMLPFQPPFEQRANPYDVWQYYGVDRQGRFRPRVIYSPSGAYYLSNGAPFPWATTHPREFMPQIVD